MGQVAQELGQNPTGRQDDQQGGARAVEEVGSMPAALGRFLRPGGPEIPQAQGDEHHRQQGARHRHRQAGEVDERLEIKRRGREEGSRGHHQAGGQSIKDEGGARGGQPGDDLEDRAGGLPQPAPTPPTARRPGPGHTGCWRPGRSTLTRPPGSQAGPEFPKASAPAPGPAAAPGQDAQTPPGRGKTRLRAPSGKPLIHKAPCQTRARRSSHSCSP